MGRRELIFLEHFSASTWNAIFIRCVCKCKLGVCDLRGKLPSHVYREMAICADNAPKSKEIFRSNMVREICCVGKIAKKTYTHTGAFWRRDFLRNCDAISMRHVNFDLQTIIMSKDKNGQKQTFISQGNPAIKGQKLLRFPSCMKTGQQPSSSS